MGARTLSTDALVLEKQPAASDGWERHILFSPDEGILAAFRRRSRSQREPPLDLFDDAAVVLESNNQGQSWFIREARLRTRHAGLGKSYEALTAASRLARLAVRNPVAAESRSPVFELLRAALAAMADTPRPDVVLFKSLYRFARDEGYPVREEWRTGLTATDRTEVDALLDRPVRAAQTSGAAVARLQRRLEDYLQANTEIILD